MIQVIFQVSGHKHLHGLVDQDMEGALDENQNSAWAFFPICKHYNMNIIELHINAFLF